MMFNYRVRKDVDLVHIVGTFLFDSLNMLAFIGMYIVIVWNLFFAFNIDPTAGFLFVLGMTAWLLFKVADFVAARFFSIMEPVPLEVQRIPHARVVSEK